MILVTVGTHSQGFDRLIQAADELAQSMDEKIIIQYGSSGYIPQYAEGVKWLTYEQIEELTIEARVVIGHAGSGTIITTLLHNKPLIVVPRLKRFKEHIDDHQMQLAFALEAQCKAVLVEDPTPGSLQEAIASSQQPAPSLNQTQGLVLALRKQLDDWRKIQRGRQSSSESVK